MQPVRTMDNLFSAMNGCCIYVTTVVPIGCVAGLVAIAILSLSDIVAGPSVRIPAVGAVAADRPPVHVQE